MLIFALQKFNNSLQLKSAAYCLNEDSETLPDNYNLRAAKISGQIETSISENLVYGDNVKALSYQRFCICCSSNAFKASV